MSAKRIATLRKEMKAANLEALVVTHLDYVRYLTGFTGTAGVLIIDTKAAHFLTDSRYTVQAGEQITGAHVHTVSGQGLASLATIDSLLSPNIRVGVAGEYVTMRQQALIRRVLPEALVIDATSLFAQLGWIKDAGELRLIEKAAAVADTAFARILGIVEPGIREKELAAELEYQMAMLGSEKPAFETIVASGHRSAMPHGLPSSKKVERGDFITFDFGATIGGYVSDMTRTVVVGKATAKQRKIYDLVLKAHLAGIATVKAGVPAQKVDAASRAVINKAGYGKRFGHGTGHGIGFYVHVGPRVAPKSEDVLRAGHVITVEPGVYLPGWGGVRIEDDIIVTRTGGRSINRSEKKLLEL